ncbi:hypothetical protein BCR34DRAFT_642906 [Clohesyomyces aquaticus]|uniref:Uncharacterized protein n=1 Tax=Clohesyomyces aquaticus TaxID=1231657 RepID=A0A1Y2A072_9PLEO|nr:hypothetical protein BCR34DRAFT_642906 [Clohesyomyces aquaticus]
MFDIPAAKRVRRNELDSPKSSQRSSPDPTLFELLRSRAHDEYIFTPAELNGSEKDGRTVSDADETELRLFAAPASSAPQSHKIRLTSPDAENGDPGFVVKRPRSYYFADRVDSEREKELQAAAVESEMVLQMANEPWPGCALPWKVWTISPAGIKKAVLVGHPKSLVTVEEKPQKRRRKGKKTRIALRKKLQATQIKLAEKEKLTKEKEEAEREKRTRRNREKKVKKKAREKAKKLAGQVGEQGVEAVSDDST